MNKTTQELREKLKKDCDLSDWKMLHPQFVRDELFLIDESLDFIDTCIAISQDNSAVVQSHIDKSLIRRPDGYDVESWHKTKPVFKCLVISPHVFVQLTDISLKKEKL